MPGSRYKYGKNDSCWDNRTGLEKILICASVIIILIVILLVVLLLLQLIQISPRSRSCSTPTCLSEVSQLVQRVDATINPCDDFYKFACGNLLKRAHGDEKLGSFFVVQDRAKRQIQEMYSEPLRYDDHRMVRVAKKLYRACMDESAIQRDGLSTIKEVLAIMGGWPVVEGPDWDESKFWWMPASYKLRELGYFYASFMGVNLEVDPHDENRFIFKVSMPDVEDFKFQTITKQRWIVDIAVAFGADENRALIEMVEMYDFMLDILRMSYMRRNDGPPQRIMVSEFQKRHNFINWRELINNIIGPAVRISRQDYVLFPSAQSLRDWHDFLLKTPKRTQANYMLWRVIEETIPYLPELPHDRRVNNFYRHSLEHQETRPEFCIRQIRERFSPSPIDIMFVQKYMPLQKRLQIEEIIQNMKAELLEMLEKAEWADAIEKKNATEKVNGLTEVVGAPEDFFEDGLLDDLDFDMSRKESDNQTFLSLLSQVKRNHKSYMYSQIYSSKYEFKLTQWNLQTASVIGDYSRKDNVITLPATIFQDIIFNELQPKYLNYGNMATMMGHHLLYMFGEPADIFDMDRNVIDAWSHTSISLLERKKKCFSKQMENFNVKTLYTTELIMRQTLGLKVAYAAYNKWANGQSEEELKLMNINYTPKQLFWISAASYFCQPSNPHSTTLRTAEERELFNFLVSVPVLNDENFSNDFNCPLGSIMNPENKCKIF